MRLNNRYVIALDIQDEYVRCVQIKYSSRGTWSVQRSSCKEIPYPEDNEDIAHHVRTAQAIESLLQEMSIYPLKNVVTFINGRDAAIKILDFPPVSDRKATDLEQMIRYELMMQLPVNVEQMGYDHDIIEKGSDKTEILTAAAKRSVLNRHLKLLSLAGVYPDVVTTSALALFNAFAVKEPESIEDGRIALVCLRDPNGDVVVCEDGVLAHARSFNFQVDGGKERLIKEINNSFDTYSRSHDSESADIERIFLITEDGQLPLDLVEDDLSAIMPKAQWKTYPAGDKLAFGSALASVRFVPEDMPLPPLRINLLKQIAQEKRSASRKAVKARLGRVAPTIAAAVLIIVLALLWWKTHRAEDELQFLENIHQVNNQRRERISQLGTVEKALRERMKILSWAADDYPMVSYRLYRIAQAIPDSLWLKEVYIPEKQTTSKKKRDKAQAVSKLYVVGYAHKQPQIDGFLSDLRSCDCFSDVKQESMSEVRLAGEEVLEFKLGLASEPRHLVKVSSGR